MQTVGLTVEVEPLLYLDWLLCLFGILFNGVEFDYSEELYFKTETLGVVPASKQILLAVVFKHFRITIYSYVVLGFHKLVLGGI